MSENEKILILLALTDNHLAHQISQKIRARFPTVPIETDRVDDGRRALSEFKQKKPDVLICSSDLPGLSGAGLAREIRKQDGSVPVFFLKSAQESAPDSVEVIPLPLVDWTDFLTKLQAALPDDFKSKYGLFNRDSAFYQRLIEFGRRYSQNDTSSTAITLIPSYFDSVTDSAPQTTLGRAAESTVKPSTPLFEFHEITSGERRKALQIELGILGILSAAALVTHLVPALAQSDQLFSLKNLTLWLASFSYLGFFLARIFDRYGLRRQKPVT